MVEDIDILIVPDSVDDDSFEDETIIPYTFNETSILTSTEVKEI